MPPHLRRRLVGEVLREQADVVAPRPQRRQVDPHHVDPVEEVAAKLAALQHLVDLAGGGGDHPDIHRVLLPGPHPPHPPLLEHAQQLRLERQRQFPHLVEEQRATVGKLHEPHPAGIGPREGAALMAEELALDQGVGDRSAVHGHERPLGPAAAGMDRPGHELLAGARLAGHQHVDGTGGHTVDDRIHLLHRPALAEKLGERIGPFHRPAEHRLLSPPPRRHEQLLERVLEVALDEGDIEVVAGARIQAGAGSLHARLGIDHHHRQLRVGLAERRVEDVGRRSGPGRDHAEIPGVAGEGGERCLQRGLHPHLERLQPSHQPRIGQGGSAGGVDDDDAGLLHETEPWAPAAANRRA